MANIVDDPSARPAFLFRHRSICFSLLPFGIRSFDEHRRTKGQSVPRYSPAPIKEVAPRGPCCSSQIFSIFPS